MPDFAILNNQIIKVNDIYKFNINKKSKFTCYTCGKELQFRQSRNGDKNYTEHFYHPNNKKGTTIECEENTYSKISGGQGKFHTMFSNFIKNDSREIINYNSNIKHIIDGYDKINKLGVEFQNSKISTDDIISRDNTTELDWIFNVENQFIKKISIGNYIICEIPHNNWEEAVKVVKNNIFLYTGYKEWIWLTDIESYRIEIDNRIRHVWIGEECSFQDVLENTCLENIITDYGKNNLQNIKKNIEIKDIIYARCKKSMLLLDTLHRNYVKKLDFEKHKIIGIKSVAGSGKTTTLLELSKIHKNKKILYLAFNKSLITEIKDKIKDKKIKNLMPKTFDSLIYEIYTTLYSVQPEIINLRPQILGSIITWFNNKPFKVKKFYCNHFSNFCNNIYINDINDFCDETFGVKKPLLIQMWKKTKNHNLVTFETMRKIVYMNHLSKNYIDNNYDMIMIDETQDFDLIMLNMLLNDSTIPKIFVGDPLQSIYQFRGCINAFNYLPKESLIIEFYSTFRTGNPACDTIRENIENCWIISKSKNNTQFVNDFNDNDNYTYLFRSWRVLLQTAETLTQIWINDFDKKLNQIKNLHKKLQFTDLSEEEINEFPDDLPKFLSSLDNYELDELIRNISKNIVSYRKSKIKLYTVHSYKGMECENIKIAEDIDISEDKNIFYVAITRGKNNIVI